MFVQKPGKDDTGEQDIANSVLPKHHFGIRSSGATWYFFMGS
jgi:hypothetical protein